MTTYIGVFLLIGLHVVTERKKWQNTKQEQYNSIITLRSRVVLLLKFRRDILT